MPPHLLVALSPHGYGHAAMTAPVVAEIRRRRPELRVTLQTSIARSWLEGRFGEDFELVPHIADFGLRQASATEILEEPTAEAYRTLHARLPQVVEQETAGLAAAGVDLVLSNISYVALLAARRAGIAAVAMSCLNWADIYGHVCAARPEAPGIEAEMLEAYGAAAVFLQPAPAMPMPRLGNLRPIGPIAARGAADRLRLRRLLGVDEGTRVGLIAFGGFAAGLSFASWARLPGWCWVVSGDPAGHPDMVDREAVAMGFTDILSACDLVVGKPGYGTFAEAAVNGVPMLYLPRPDWPETPFLIDWLAAQGRCLPVAAVELFDEVALAMRLQMLFSLPDKPLVEPNGIPEAADAILAELPGRVCIRT